MSRESKFGSRPTSINKNETQYVKVLCLPTPCNLSDAASPYFWRLCNSEDPGSKLSNWLSQTHDVQEISQVVAFYKYLSLQY